MKFVMPTFADKLKSRIKDLDDLSLQNGGKPHLKLPGQAANWLWIALAATLGVASLLAFQNYSLIHRVRTSESQLKKLQSETSAQIAQATQERDALKEQFETMQAKFTPLEKRAKDAEDRASQAEEEKTYLEEILINKSKEIEAVRKASTPQEIAQRIKDKDEEISKLSDQNTILQQKLAKLYKAVDEELADLSKNYNIGDAIVQAKKRIQDKSSTIDLGSITVASAAEPQIPVVASPASAAAVQSQPSAGPTVPARTEPKKQGRVLAINDQYNFVVVDLGKVDGLEQDSTLSLKKNGNNAATLTIMELRDVMSACNLGNLPKGIKPEINDEVVILKKR